MEYGDSKYDAIIGSKTKQMILELFRENKGKRFSTKDINEKIKEPQSSVNRALNGLESLGILEAAQEGKFKYFSLNSDISSALDKMFDYLESVRRFTLEQRKKAKVKKDETSSTD